MNMYCIYFSTKVQALVRVYDVDDNAMTILGVYDFDKWRDFRSECANIFEVLSVDISFDDVIITLARK